jgi:hypothetical protein
MRRAAAGLLVLACAAMVGCLHPNRPSVPEIVRKLTPPLAIDGVIVDSVLVEQPRGDTFLDWDLWASTQPVGSPEARALFIENGLRAGIITGSIPQPLQDLLISDADTVNPQRMTFNQRKEAVIPTAGPIESEKFSVLTDLGGKRKTVELKQVNCGMLIRPEATPGGRVKLWCEPQMQHGSRQGWFRPNEDATQFTMHREAEIEKYPSLGLETMLGPDECLLIGWTAEQTESLGSVMFAAESDNRPRQRVLLIRARQAKPPGATDLPPLGGSSRRPPVAAIAAAQK